jgi:hypothetical protein
MRNSLWVWGALVLMIAFASGTWIGDKLSCQDIDANDLAPDTIVAFWEHSNCTGAFFTIEKEINSPVIAGLLAYPAKPFDRLGVDNYSRVSSLKIFKANYMVTLYAEISYQGIRSSFTYYDLVDSLVPYYLNDRVMSFKVVYIGPNRTPA